MRGISPAETAEHWVTVRDGIEMRPLVEGEGTGLFLYRIEPGLTFRPHEHRFPEYGTMILGRGRLLLDGQPRELNEGDSYYIPGGVAHGFDSPPQPGPVVLLHVVVGEQPDGEHAMFGRVLERTREVVRPLARAARSSV